LVTGSVAYLAPNPDPSDPDPSDPYFFGPPGSGFGSISQRYGFGSGLGPFYHQAKIVRKTLITTVLRLLFVFLSMKNDEKVKSRKTFQKKSVFCWPLEGH
jgi:hypothetical protein